MDIGVVGAGAWGTALAKMLGEKGHAITLWGREAELVANIREKRENTRYLPGASLPATVHATADLDETVHAKPMVVAVVPSHGMRDVMARAARSLAVDAIVVSASKGIENETLQTMDEVLGEVLPRPHASRGVYLSGPSFAKEVGQRLPTAVVVASRDEAAARTAQAAFGTDRFRVYTSSDVVGVELGGAVKNVIAIGAGISDGLGFGHNTRAALITRGLAEMGRLAVRRGANPLTLAGLAGIGDLVLTCTGDLSRNRGVGLRLGRGEKLADVLAGMDQIAEGVRTTRSVRDLGRKLGVELPITDTVHAILFDGLPPAEGVAALLSRPMKHEIG